MRWWEEVQMIKAEIARVLRTLRWEAERWNKRRAAVDTLKVDAMTANGLRAYARAQSQSTLR